MSGLILIHPRDGSPASLESLVRAMQQMKHRGPDGGDTLICEGAALGHQHFNILPEETGERQPITNTDGDCVLIFEGRLDNRADLIAGLNIAISEGRTLSDAVLALRAYERWGDRCMRQMIGSFAFALYDSTERRALLVRDSLGDCTLFYRLDSRVLVAASEPMAVLAALDMQPEIDEDSLIRWYAIEVPESGTTLFKGIHELPPAHALSIEGARVRLWRYWSPDGEQEISYRSDEEYAEHFRSLLEEAVRCSLRSATRPAVLMSGGYDSTSVACLAAWELAAQNGSTRLRTISWLFDEFKECDEREPIEAVNRAYRTEPIQFLADEAWALRNWEHWPRNLNHPEGNPYRFLKMLAYDAAAQAGSRVVLTGWFGSYLSSGGDAWLGSLLRERRIGQAMRGVAQHVRTRRSLLGMGLWGLVSTARPREPRAPLWLTDYAANRWDQMDNPASSGQSQRPSQGEAILGAMAAFNASAEVFYASSAGVEVRHPYRDRRLAEFMMAIPTHRLFDGLKSKTLIYESMRGILPDSVRAKRSIASLMPLFLRGFLDREQAGVQAVLDAPDALWRRYVRADSIAAIVKERLIAQKDGRATVVPWRCVGVEWWHQALTRSNPPIPLQPIK